jgi:hypothetical protein
VQIDFFRNSKNLFYHSMRNTPNDLLSKKEDARGLIKSFTSNPIFLQPLQRSQRKYE